jgi:glycosyltransferase involved in cell wall biosynthesis
MPSVLIICAHRPKRSPSQRYRFEQYLPLLEEKGFQFTWSYLLNEKDDKTFYSKGNFILKVWILLKTILIRLKDTFRFKHFDIIFIQREASFLGTSYFEKKAFQSGAHVIFDFDDSIWLADTSPENKKWEFIKKPDKFFENLKYAHTVIAGNASLSEKARTVQPNVVVVPTTVDTSVHYPKPELRNKTPLTIGWSGSISTIKHFETLLPILIRIKERYKERVKFKILGQKHYRSEKLDIDVVEWSESNEVNELNTFDIGIMPLPNDEWVNGKCGLKGLTYMACGVCTVMEQVGVNTKIVRHGSNGFLAENEYEWFNLLCELIENKSLRNEMGMAGRETVIKNYSVEANKEKYFQVFSNGTD